MKVPASNSAKRILVVVVFLSTLAALFGPSLLRHAAASANHLVMADDARPQIAPFLENPSTGKRVGGTISEYYLRVFLPAGFQALYSAVAVLWDAEPFSKLLPYLLLAAMLVFVGIAANRLGGIAAAWGAVALCLSTEIFLWRMAGGLPRAFGFPLVAAALACLATGRFRLLALTTVAGAAFYPMMSVVSGVSLAAALAILPNGDRGDAAEWSRRKRAAWVSGTALFCAVLVLPNLIASRDYGRLLAPGLEPDFPEVNRGGRMEQVEIAPFPDLDEGLIRLLPSAFLGSDNAILPPARQIGSRVASLFESALGPRDSERRTLVAVLLAFLAAGALLPTVAGRRVLVFAVTAIAAFLVSRALYPYLYVPTRFLLYPGHVAAILVAVSLPAVLGGFIDARRESRWARPTLILACTGLILALFGGRGSDASGLVWIVDRPLYERIAALPAGTVVAGWPSGPIENVPYLSRQEAFLTAEAHVPHHEKYILELRERTNTFLEAYFATDAVPLCRLAEHWGVTHLIVDLRHVARGAPPYPAPFTGKAAALKRRAASEGFAVMRHGDEWVWDVDSPFATFDLRRLGPICGQETPPSP